MDARRLRIDCIKPSCFNRRGRPRLAGGGDSESGGPAPAGASSAAAVAAARWLAASEDSRHLSGRMLISGTDSALKLENADLRHRLQKAQKEEK